MTRKKLDAAAAAITKRFGVNVIGVLEGAIVDPIPVRSTGIPALNDALGVGGLPCGQVIEIFGAADQLTIALHAIAEAQRAGGVCAFIDAEHALDVNLARRLGVRPDELLIAQPDCGEQGLEIADTLTCTGAVDLIVINSINSLTSRAEIDGELNESQASLQARLVSQALRKLYVVASRTQTVIVVLGGLGSGTGGNALKFYAAVRLEVRRIGVVKNGDEVVGHKVRVKVVKNKVAPPFREAGFEVEDPGFGEPKAQS